MKVIQGLDNPDLKSEEDQATAECSEMEVEQSVEEIKSKIAAEDININEKEEQSVEKGEETNGHDLKNGVDETKTVMENGVSSCAVKDIGKNLDVELVSEDSKKNTPETKSDSPITDPENKDEEVELEGKVEDTISDNDTAKTSDKEESASAYESATNGEESPTSLDETFELAKSEQVCTGENVKPTEDNVAEVPTSEDLMNDLEKLTQDEDEIDNQEKLLDSGDDETRPESKSIEASPTNLLQEDDIKDEINEMPLSSSDPKTMVELDSNEASKIIDDIKDEPNSESIADDEVFSEEVSENATLSGKDLDVKMECEDTRFLEQYPHPDKDDQMESSAVEKVKDITDSNRKETEDITDSNGKETTSIIEKEKDLESEKEKDLEPEKEKDLEPEKEKDLEPEKEKTLDATEKDPEVAKKDLEKESSNEMEVTDKDLEKETSKETADLVELVNDKESTDVTMDVEDDDCTITTAETPEPPVDFEEALGGLDKIRDRIDKIFNDDDEVKSDKKAGSKRSLSESSESKDIDSKKAKMSDTDNDIIDQESQLEGETSAESESEKVQQIKATKKKLKKQIKKLTRSELENILSIKMIEMMTNKSEMGKLRQQADSMKGLIDKWQKRAEGLRKQCTDLSTVMRKYIVDTKNKPKEKVRPVMITRSVGLQVMSSQQRIAAQGKGPLIRKGPGRPPGSSPVKTINATVPPRVIAATKLIPKVAQNGVVRNGPSPARSPAAAENVVTRPVVSTPQPRPRQMGGTTMTTISPSKGSTPPIQPATVQSTPTPSPQPSSSQGATVATATKTIDVVDLDLSDDEDTPAPVPVPPPQRQMHTVQRGMVRPGFAGRGRGGQQSFRMTSDERLVPVQQQQQIIRQQNQPRMMHRPMMGRPRPPLTRPPGHRPSGQHPMALKHPAPLPMMPQHQPSSPGWQNLPNRPSLQIKKNDAASGIVLSWDMKPPPYAGTITYFQLFAYQESSQQRPDPNLWKKVGDVKALPLPMACTLTQFAKGNRYHFAVRAMDNHQRVGNFSEPGTIKLD